MAEWIIIKALYTNPNHLVNVAEQVETRDFTYKPFRIIYSAIKQLISSDTVVNAESIMALLQSKAPQYYKEMVDIGGIDTLETLYDPAYKSLTNLDEHIATVTDQSSKQQVIAATTKLQSELTRDDIVLDEVVGEFEQSVQSVRLRGKKSQIDRIGDSMDELLDRIVEQDDDVLGISIEHKFPRINRMLKRIQPNRVTVFLSNYKTGKSSLLLEIGWTIAEQGHAVLFGDTEMFREEFQLRLLSKLSQFPMDYIRSGKWKDFDEHRQLIYAAKQKISDTPFYWVNVNHMSRSEMSALVKLSQLKYNIKVFIFDYIKSDSNTPDGRIDKQIASRVDMLKEDIAKTCNISVLSAVQLNESTNRAADSKDVYRLADSVILLRKVQEDDPESQQFASHLLIMDTSRYTEAGQRVPLTIDFAKQSVMETL